MFRAPWNPRDVVFAALLSAAAIMVALLALFAVADPSGADDSPLPLEGRELLGVPSSIVLFALLEGMFVIAALTFSVVKYGAGLASLGFTRPQGNVPYLFAVGAWIAGLAGVLVWTYVVDLLNASFLIPPETARSLLDEAGGSIVIAFVLVGAWGPIAEEIFFRGFAMPGLANRYSMAAAVMLSSALFALAHLDIASLVPTFILGLVLAWVYLRTRSIWPCIFMHGLHNTAALILAKVT